MTAPLAVCCGVGVDSVAMLVGMKERGIRPDLNIFADVGAERDATYDYIPVLNDWLERVGFPKLVVVKYVAKNFKHWPPYYSLEENILTNVTLPSIAYGFHTCSAKNKATPINQYCDQVEQFIQWWAGGGKVLKAIGFEDSKHERKRTKKCATFATSSSEGKKYELIFPLQTWGWSRERCVTEIIRAGLPVPSKSSCYFCTAMRVWEVDALPVDKLKRIVVIEARTAKRHLDFARARAKAKGVVWDGKPITEGLWRKPVKGCRGATPKPGSMTQYIRDKALLPGAEVDRLIAATPTHHLSQADFARDGVSNWQEWLRNITDPMTDEQILDALG